MREWHDCGNTSGLVQKTLFLRVAPVSFAHVWRVEDILLMFDIYSKDCLECLANLDCLAG